MNIIVDSYIRGEFSGWSGETLFKLGNNECWIQSQHSYIYQYAYQPGAKIVEENGMNYLFVDGMTERVQVRKVSNIIESKINDEFEGWEGETKFELENGQTWKQSEYDYTYHYAYRPNVIIYEALSGYRLKVEGMKQSIGVRKI